MPTKPKAKWCWHKWESCPRPEGWLMKEFYYRRCVKCDRYQARGPAHYNANFWQDIEVPYRGIA